MTNTEPTLQEQYDQAVFLPVNPPGVNGWYWERPTLKSDGETSHES